MMKYLHKLFSKLGLSLGGYEACLKYGCKDYCGNSVSQALAFTVRKHEVSKESINKLGEALKHFDMQEDK